MALIQYLTRLRFGTAEIGQLSEELLAANVFNPLIVTDVGVRQAGILDKVIDILPMQGIPIHDSVHGDASEEKARAAAHLYLSYGCDGIIGLGGGAALDQAKATAVMVADSGALERHAFFSVGMTPNIGGNIPPLILIGTSAGTGAEVNRGCVVTLANGRKTVIILPANSIFCAIADPALTITLPARETAATGLDAISHCIETYCSPRFNPPADAIALDGLKRSCRHINVAVQYGEDITARSEMLMASIEGALCFQKGLGAVHALSHPLGTYGVHHGTLNGILLPRVLDANSEALGPRQKVLQSCLAEALRTSSLSSSSESIRTLLERLSMPTRLREVIPVKPDFDLVARYAMEEPAHLTNPSIWDLEGYLRVLEESW